MKSPRTWVVVADGAHARILLNEGRANGLAALPGGHFEQENLASGEIASSPPGRVYESAGGQRHSVGFRSDPHEQREREFLSRIVTHLDGELTHGRFDHVIIVAPPKALGHLRKEIKPPLLARVKAEFSHDYAHQTNAELMALIHDALPL
jgi:protein required for attachment to host cells